MERVVMTPADAAAMDYEWSPGLEYVPCHGCGWVGLLEAAIPWEGEWYGDACACAWNEVAGLIEGELDSLFTPARSIAARLNAIKVAEILIARAKKRVDRDAEIEDGR